LTEGEDGSLGELSDGDRSGAGEVTVLNLQGELFFAAATELPFLNCALREGPGGDAPAFLDRAREWFFARGRGFVTYTWPGDPDLEPAALGAGFFEVLPRYPEMVCRAPVAPIDADLRPVESDADAAAYWRICDAAYPDLGMPPGIFTEIFTPGSLLPSDTTSSVLAHLDDRPVACATVYLAEGVGMIGWVGALQEARGRGLAAACTVWATNRGFAMGADVASLQASVMGEAIYERLGYEELYSYRLLGLMPS